MSRTASGSAVPTNYFTLRQLVREWRTELPGRRLIDAYSQERGELTLAFDGSDGQALKISVQAPHRYVYRSMRTARARKNVADHFEAASGDVVAGLDMAENDRVIELRLSSGCALRTELFGPRANIYLVDSDRRIAGRFRERGREIGSIAPAPSGFALPSTHEAFVEALRGEGGDLHRQFSRVVPVLDRTLRTEVLFEAGLLTEPGNTETVSPRLFPALQRLLAALENPQPRVYCEGERVVELSLLPLGHVTGLREEPFPSVDEAVRYFVRRMLAQSAYDTKRGPMASALAGRLEKDTRSREKMAADLGLESRADTYERYGHVLMAQQQLVQAGSTEATLPDIISGEGDLAIPLRAELSAVQNAERYYDRARQSRSKRRHAGERLERLDRRIAEVTALLRELDATTTAADVERFESRHHEALVDLTARTADSRTGIPFRRYVLPDGYEVWVGRNAAQNDELTLRNARKFDIWMHARGLAGSHVVLRVPRRDEKPSRRILERAASIAAWHSKGRTSELVPVIVAERRYVRKPSKSPPGTVAVERETVLLVPPELPKR